MIGPSIERFWFGKKKKTDDGSTVSINDMGRGGKHRMMYDLDLDHDVRSSMVPLPQAQGPIAGILFVSLGMACGRMECVLTLVGQDARATKTTKNVCHRKFSQEMRLHPPPPLSCSA